jgi:hypothetical protein
LPQTTSSLSLKPALEKESLYCVLQYIHGAGRKGVPVCTSYLAFRRAFQLRSHNNAFVF